MPRGKEPRADQMRRLVFEAKAMPFRDDGAVGNSPEGCAFGRAESCGQQGEPGVLPREEDACSHTHQKGNDILL